MKDVEFAVDDADGKQRIYTSFDKAAGFAVVMAASTGRTSNIDVLIYSRAGARAYAGEEGVEQYEDDPDASVFERIEVRADSRGHIR